MKDNIYDEFEVNTLKKIKNGIKLTDSELWDLINYEVEGIYSNNQKECSICKICDSYFLVEWVFCDDKNGSCILLQQPYKLRNDKCKKTTMIKELIKKYCV